jgi:hypothetical protein
MKYTFTITDLITAIIAIYGAVLSTIILCNEYKKTNREIKLALKTGVLTYDNGLLSPLMLLMEIMNPGQKNVTIYSPHIRIRDGKNMLIPEPNSTVRFPYELVEGKSVTVWIEMSILKQVLIENNYSGSVQIKTFISDQTGKEFFSKRWMKIDLK